MAIELTELDTLQKAYKDAVDRWIAAIRAEENLATPDHSISAWEIWEQAGFQADEARARTNNAKEAYKDGLRLLDYGI
jgi:hypothetical protein